MVARWAHLVVAVALVAGGIVWVAGCERRLGHEAECGDGVVEAPETCDGDCPASCDDGDACTTDVLSGSPETCDARCTNEPVVSCVSGDGCCPGGCNALNDADCEPRCGNGVVEPPEICDGDCPTDCDDADTCTTDELRGSEAQCDVRCVHVPVTACTGGDGCCPGGGAGACNALNDGDCAPLCGNGVLEPPEECDDGSTIGGDGCSAGCEIEVCGNGVVDVGEQCDDGNTVDGDGCSADCLSDETCGNGVVDVVNGEECDDGNALDWDGCTGCTICTSCEFQVNTYTSWWYGRA